MNYEGDNFSFRVPLTWKEHQLAQNFRQHHHSPKKAQQVYLNTLAVCAVDFYLKCLGIETEVEAGDSWNPVLQILVDTADLVVKHRGKLECRPILAEEIACCVPPEVWEERIGYVVVQFDRALEEATLLGFVPTVSSFEIPRTSWRSLEELLELLSQPVAQINPLVDSSVTRISDWLSGVIERGWTTAETLLLPSPGPACNFRSEAVRPETRRLKFGKSLDVSQWNQQLYLLFGIALENESEIDISVEVLPANPTNTLPEGLQLTLLDETEQAILQALVTSELERMEFQFSVEQGEYFSVRVALGNSSFIERFVI